MILLPAHPASFAHDLSQGCKVFISAIPGCKSIADLTLKIVFWTHEFAVDHLDSSDGRVSAFGAGGRGFESRGRTIPKL